MAEEAGSAVADRGGDLERMVLGILDKGPVLGMEQLLARIREETTATSTKNKQASENSTTLKDCQEVVERLVSEQKVAAHQHSEGRSSFWSTAWHRKHFHSLTQETQTSSSSSSESRTSPEEAEESSGASTSAPTATTTTPTATPTRSRGLRKGFVSPVRSPEPSPEPTTKKPRLLQGFTAPRKSQSATAGGETASTPRRASGRLVPLRSSFSTLDAKLADQLKEKLETVERLRRKEAACRAFEDPEQVKKLEELTEKWVIACQELLTELQKASPEPISIEKLLELFQIEPELVRYDTTEEGFQ